MTDLSPRLLITETAREILESRYFWKKKSGRGFRLESYDEMLRRVAGRIGEAESTQAARRRWTGIFGELLTSGRFLPNSPTLMNAGKPDGQLAACFVLPIEDSLVSIYETLKNAALIQQSGGGTGFDFSRLRPKGSRVGSTDGTAAGPLGFLRVFDVSTEVVKQGGMRRGANMAVLRVDHPDVREFIRSKVSLREFTNFNLSVGVTDRFMKAALRNGSKEHETFTEIVDSAWRCGDPGLLFLDRINRDNPTPRLGTLDATNPCGEQPLLAYESCNLGSLNLVRFWSKAKGGLDWALLGRETRTAVRFLDNVIELNCHAIRKCEEAALKTRKIGLGVMGFADLLLKAAVPYDSREAATFGEKIMVWIRNEARLASIELAGERGAFPAWKGSKWQRAGMKKLRNATLTTVAPTGTLSAIAGVSSGIEPIFSAVLKRNVLGGRQLVEVHPTLVEMLGTEKVGAWRGDLDLLARQELGSAWMVARDVSIEGHLRVQAAFQKGSDSGVSKTVNLPSHATRESVARAYSSAFRLGCKGITVFRDGCRGQGEQVLEEVQTGEQKEHIRCLDCS